jgi:hypothetical protein
MSSGINRSPGLVLAIVGTMAGVDAFDPKYAINLQNKDKVMR